jgi:propionyl-CoA carboxylase alpha chain
MIKASAGGGGKGMRIAHSKAEVAEGFARAKSEAKSSFGDDRVFIEKFIVNPRHIEIQVLGDKHGNIIHLGERECSIQRRNQKVVEEAPSPLIDAATRAKMGAQAVALAKAVGYDSAGTVEFVADQAKNFYFLEMNTRLQVEHPVTELVTGIDLVEQMIRVAAGEKLGLTQAGVHFNGWAVETRIYAEDPVRNFLPSTGRLTRYRAPEEASVAGATVRVDTGVGEGGEISIHYDPMIAKLVTHAPARAGAIAAQANALDAFVIDGIRHNIPFLSALMAHPRWREGRLSTAFIAEEFPDGFHPRKAEGRTAFVLAAIAAVLDDIGNARKRAISGQLAGPAVCFARRRIVRLDDAEFVAEVGWQVRAVSVSISEPQQVVLTLLSPWWPSQLVWHGSVDGEILTVQVRTIPNGYSLSHQGITVAARVFTEAEAAAARLMPEKTSFDAGKAVRCPMPGLVVSLAVVEGQEIKAGEPLAVVEAMKMENILRAERDGVVAKIHARPGDSLAVDAVILEFA